MVSDIVITAIVGGLAGSVMGSVITAIAQIHTTNKQQEAETEELIEGFVEELPRRVSRGTRDPVNGDRLDSNMDRSTRKKAIKKAKVARKRMREAQDRRRDGDSEGANEKYGDALGEDID